MSGGNYDRRSVEVLYSNGTSYCSLPDLPEDRYHHSQAGLTACGGSGTEDNCVTLTSGQWTQSHTLLHNRAYHSSWALGDGRVVLIGGSNSPATTEIMSPGSSSSIEGFSLKHDT